MPRLQTIAPVTALVYADSTRAAATMRRLVTAVQAAGASVQGYVQYDLMKPGRSRCDMVLENIATGHQLAISQDRGPGARGCQLDENCLATAMVDLQSGLADMTDLMILNKFGKSEAEGGGFRPLIANALDRGIPVVLGVSWRNVEAWRVFAGDLGREVCLDNFGSVDDSMLLDAFGITVPGLVNQSNTVVQAINPLKAI